MDPFEPESHHIETAREKLRNKIQREGTRFSPESIQRAISTIKRSIARHHSKSFLKEREFTLFDENFNSAKPKSKQIAKLKQVLEIELARPIFNFRAKGF